jgi:hypothetical protein
MDRNPRHFFVSAVEIDANVDADSTRDFVTIEFAGRLSPTLKNRLLTAITEGEFVITEKKFA